MKSFNADYYLDILYGDTLTFYHDLPSSREKARHAVPPASFDLSGNPGENMKTMRTLFYPAFQHRTQMNDKFHPTGEGCEMSWKRPRRERTPALTAVGNVAWGKLFSF